MQSDDIVTRLRDVAPHAKAADPLSADPFLWSLTGLVNGAADEIERLRADRDRWRKIASERDFYSWGNLMRRKWVQ